MRKVFQNYYAKLTLHRKVRLSILAFALVPLIFLACMFLSMVYRSRIGNLRDEVLSEMQNEYQDMENVMNTVEVMAKIVWSDTDFVTEVGKAAVDKKRKGYDIYFFQRHTLSTLRIITSITQVQGVRIYLDYPELREYVPYLYNMDRAVINRWYEDRERLTYSGAWYLDVTDEKKEKIFSDYFHDDNMASYVLPLRITSDLGGILEIILPMEAIASRLFEKADTRDIFLMDSTGRLFGVEEEGKAGDITEQDILRIMKLESLRECEEKGVCVYHGVWNHEPVLLTVMKNGSNIFLMQLTFVKDQYLLMAGEIFLVLMIEVLLLLFLLWVIDQIVSHLLHDFAVFSGSIREVAAGNLDVKIPTLEQVEINEVAVEYNRMLVRVKELMEIGIHREVMVKEAQLKSLEKQIDSHFLYNVLDSIKMMAEVKGIYNVSDALLALGRMFRYNLQIDHCVTLQEEIAYLESYLKLCNLRYDYDIYLGENVEDSLRTLRVPKVILQPVAENAIVHGLDEMVEDTTIYLKVYVKERDACIEMTDMGKGMDEETLCRVRSGILDSAGKSGPEDGIGLHNIHERLQLMYGERYGVEIYSKEGCYTKVVLRLSADSVNTEPDCE